MQKHGRNPIVFGMGVFQGSVRHISVCKCSFVCVKRVYGTCLYFNLIETTKQGLKKTEPEKQSAWNNKQSWCIGDLLNQKKKRKKITSRYECRRKKYTHNNSVIIPKKYYTNSITDRQQERIIVICFKAFAFYHNFVVVIVYVCVSLSFLFTYLCLVPFFSFPFAVPFSR